MDEDRGNVRVVEMYDINIIVGDNIEVVCLLLKVLRYWWQMPHGEVYELITPFEPAPLIDQAKTQGFKTITRKENDDLFRTYFKHVDD